MNGELEILENSSALYQRAAEELLIIAKNAIAKNGSFAVVLSGGSTPRGLYSLLAGEPRFRNEIPWQQAHFFWGDERHVPPGHPDGNFRMACETMLDIVPVPRAHIHRIPSELPDAEAAATDYERTLRAFFRLSEGEWPRFPLVLLGLGPDGHTASLFPNTKALSERERLVAGNWVEKFNTWRITMTAPLLNNAENVLFLVSGSEKASALKDVLKDDSDPRQYPARLIRPIHGRLLWLVDKSAAAGLDN